MKAEIEKEYKEKLRDFMARKGSAVKFDKRWDFQDDDEVSPYGWTDFEAEYHILGQGYRKDTGGPCKWVVPEGAELYERTYSMFDNTFTDNKPEAGINVTGCHCECGKYSDVTLRFVGSLTEVLHDILGIPTQTRLTL